MRADDAWSRPPSALAAEDVRAVVAEHPVCVAAVGTTGGDWPRLREVRAVDDPRALAALPAGPQSRRLMAHRTNAALALGRREVQYHRMRSTHALSIVPRGRVNAQSTKSAHARRFYAASALSRAHGRARSAWCLSGPSSSAAPSGLRPSARRRVARRALAAWDSCSDGSCAAARQPRPSRGGPE